MKSFKIQIPFLFIIILLLFLNRNRILKATADFLIVEDTIDFVQTGFVLSGGAFDRGNQAAWLWNQDKIGNIICTGANQPPDFKALNFEYLESEITRKNIIRQIGDSSKISLLKEGTSTKEESNFILKYCLQNNIKKCVIITSKFHTRRAQKVFKEKFKDENIEIFIQGAASSSYKEEEWWKSENGLIALNNEYIKLIYYTLKY